MIIPLGWITPRFMSGNSADAVIFAVADEEGAVGIDPDAVRAGQPAGGGRAVGAVALLAGADDELETPGLRVDLPDGVAFGVDEEDVAGGPDRDALGARERRLPRRAAV